MSVDLLARLLALVDQGTPEGRAVAAVINRHAPTVDDVCMEDADPDNPYVAVPWPCPTVRDIAEALGVRLVEELPQ